MLQHMFYEIESAFSGLLYKHIFVQTHFQLTDVIKQRGGETNLEFTIHLVVLIRLYLKLIS